MVPRIGFAKCQYPARRVREASIDSHGILLGLHTAAGVAGLALGGLVIWLSRERPLVDDRSAAYHWTVLAVSLTAVGLLILDWPNLWWLMLLAALAYGLPLLGYLPPRRRFRGWTGVYAHGQGGSYVALVTAFVVVSLTVDGGGARRSGGSGVAPPDPDRGPTHPTMASPAQAGRGADTSPGRCRLNPLRPEPRCKAD